MHVSEFDYDLPEELIAQEPLADRAASRMLIVDRAARSFRDAHFRDLPSLLGPGDCLIMNDSRVLPSRLFGRRLGVRALPVGRHHPQRDEHLSGVVELLLVRPAGQEPDVWEALVRPGRKIGVGEIIHIGAEGGPHIAAAVLARGERGLRTLRLTANGPLLDTIEALGHMPLPPYIKREDTTTDRERYQTVYAQERGSAAAPTAGLHFTPAILDQIRANGAETVFVTLHTGLGTFQPLHAETTAEVKLHAEWFRVPPATQAAVERARRRIAVGTTATRSLETCARGQCEGETELFISPGFEFKSVDCLLTNFHLPQSSLVMLVCALGGTELIMAAYRHAVAQRYRFYSYGDCMLVL